MNALTGTIIGNPRTKSEATFEPTTTSKTNQHQKKTPKTTPTQTNKKQNEQETLASLSKNNR